MSMKLAQELTDKRVKLVKDARELLDRAEADGKQVTADDLKQFETMMAESKELKAKIDELVASEESAKARRSELEAEERALAEISNLGELRDHRGSGSFAGGSPSGQLGRPSNEDFALAVQAWALHERPSGVITDAHKKAAARCGIDVGAKELVLQLNPNFREFRNTLTTTTPSTGQVLIAPSFVNNLERAMLNFGPMLRVADIIRTGTAAPMQWPTANDTGNSGVQIGESVAVTEQDPSFAAVTWNAYKYSSKEVKVPFELLRDSAVNLSQILADMLGERLGRVINTKATTGTGAGTFSGIVTDATLGKTTASSTALTMDELLALKYSVDESYRTGAVWMANDQVWLVIRTLKSDNNNYHWQPSVVAGQPDRFWSDPYYTNNDMASSVAASAKTVLYGQFGKYKIRQVGTIRLYRLTERYRETDQDAFLAFTEADGHLLDAGVAPVKYLQQKAA